MCYRCFVVAVFLSLVPALDAQPAPVGRWKTVDDSTSKVKSLVAIWEDKGLLYGKIEKIVEPEPDNPELKCIHCDGNLKDKPLVGLQIITGLKKQGDQWSGGKILDPHNGKFYKCFISIQDGGK